MKELVMSWSGGKDSAYALWRLMKDPAYAVKGMLTTVTEGYDRISMHGVREALLVAQADAIGLTLHKVMIPPNCSNSEYEKRIGAVVKGLIDDGIEAFGFGDLYLEDIREYREKQLEPFGLEAVFPLWGEETAALAHRMIGEGFRTTLCSIDPRKLDPSFVGRLYDEALLEALPEGVDPCGENGEFHTFVHDGPLFSQPIPIAVGDRVEREGFWFADILPGKPVPGKSIPEKEIAS